jgi:hypothetical protein
LPTHVHPPSSERLYQIWQATLFGNIVPKTNRMRAQSTQALLVVSEKP